MTDWAETEAGQLRSAALQCRSGQTRCAYCAIAFCRMLSAAKALSRRVREPLLQRCAALGAAIGPGIS